MKTSGLYLLDRNLILLKAYHLLCVAFANKEITRRSHPNDDCSLSVMEARFFEAELSRLLLQLAISIRVLDDQIKQIQYTDCKRQEYQRRVGEVNRYDFAMFDDDPKLTFRDVCNKIIHSDIMEPHFREGHEAHELDIAHREDMSERTIDWRHFNGFIRLKGFYKKKPWFVLLEVEVFVKAIYRVYSDPLDASD